MTFYILREKRAGCLLLDLGQKKQKKILLFLGVLPLFFGIAFLLHFLFNLTREVSYDFLLDGLIFFSIGLHSLIKETSHVEIREKGIYYHLFFIDWKKIQKLELNKNMEDKLVLTHSSRLPINSSKIEIDLLGKRELVEQILLQYLPPECNIS
jgi:uncharacterized membrane protein YobD (UPF0266 family)